MYYKATDPEMKTSVEVFMDLRAGCLRWKFEDGTEGSSGRLQPEFNVCDAPRRFAPDLLRKHNDWMLLRHAA